MVWSTRRAWQWGLIGGLVVAACAGDDDDGASTSAADDGSGAPTSAGDDGGTTASDDDAGSTGGGSADGSSSGSSAADDGSTDDDGATGTNGTSEDTGSPVACADAMCGPQEVCVLPCCGGAPPACEPLPAGGECPKGSTVVGPEQCAFGCDADMCCMPFGDCEPAPPYCADAAELVCGGQPRVQDQCSLGDCFGTLTDGQLGCTCA